MFDIFQIRTRDKKIIIQGCVQPMTYMSKEMLQFVPKIRAFHTMYTIDMIGTLPYH